MVPLPCKLLTSHSTPTPRSEQGEGADRDLFQSPVEDPTVCGTQFPQVSNGDSISRSAHFGGRVSKCTRCLQSPTDRAPATAGRVTLPPAQSPGKWLSHTDLEPRLSPSAPQPGRGFLAFIRQEFWQTSGCPAGEEGRLEEASTACTFPALCSVTPHKPEKGAPQPGSQRRPLRPRAHQPPGCLLPGRISSTGPLCRGSLAECQRRGPHEFEKSDGGHSWLGEASKDRQGASELEAERQERAPPPGGENRWACQDAHMKAGPTP